MKNLQLFHRRPNANSTFAPPMSKKELKHLLDVVAIRSRNSERDIALIMTPVLTGLRVSELAQIEVQHVLTPDGKYRLESWLPGQICKGGKSAAVFFSNKKLRAALDKWFEYRNAKGWQINRENDNYRGMRPDSTLFLSERGHAFALKRKPHTTKDGEKREYIVCDVLERFFKRHMQTAFGPKTNFSSHSCRRTYANLLRKLVNKKRYPWATMKRIQILMRHENFNITQDYLHPSRDEVLAAYKKLDEIVYV